MDGVSELTTYLLLLLLLLLLYWQQSAVHIVMAMHACMK